MRSKDRTPHAGRAVRLELDPAAGVEAADRVHQAEQPGADEVVELMVGYLFLHPGAAEPPTSREVAFVRFLDLIASHPWGELPLFIDPEEETTAEIMQALEKKMDSPEAPSMCIWTPYDGDGDAFTQRGPSAVVLKRAQALAARAAVRLKTLLQGRDGMTGAGDVDGVRLGDETAW